MKPVGDSIPNIPTEDVNVNIFEALTLEETSEAEEIASTNLTMLTIPATLEQKYDLEANQNDVMLGSQFFFGDLNRIRIYLRNIWEDFVLDKTDLCTATMTTNVAIERIRQSVQGIRASFSDMHDAPEKQDWLRWFYGQICPGSKIYLPGDVNYLFDFSTTRQAELTLLVSEKLRSDANPPSKGLELRITNDPDETDLPKQYKRLFEKDDIYLSCYLADLYNARVPEIGHVVVMDDITRAVFVEVQFMERMNGQSGLSLRSRYSSTFRGCSAIKAPRLSRSSSALLRARHRLQANISNTSGHKLDGMKSSTRMLTRRSWSWNNLWISGSSKMSTTRP
jgi:hypothetical protein